MSATCRYCSAPIIWVRTAAGRAMPLDAEPNPDGNVELVERFDGPDEVLVHAQPPLATWGVIYMPHFATCPNYDKEAHHAHHRT